MPEMSDMRYLGKSRMVMKSAISVWHFGHHPHLNTTRTIAIGDFYLLDISLWVFMIGKSDRSG